MKDKTKSELQIQSEITGYLRKHNILYMKLNDKFLHGIPDLHFYYENIPFWVEVKSRSGRLSVLQGRWLIKLSENGCAIGVVHSLDEFKDLLVMAIDTNKMCIPETVVDKLHIKNTLCKITEWTARR